MIVVFKWCVQFDTLRIINATDNTESSYQWALFSFVHMQRLNSIYHFIWWLISTPPYNTSIWTSSTTLLSTISCLWVYLLVRDGVVSLRNVNIDGTACGSNFFLVPEIFFFFYLNVHVFIYKNRVHQYLFSIENLV